MDGTTNPLTEGEELHVVELDAKGEPITPEDAAPPADANAPGYDEDSDEDARLAEDHESDDAESANRKRRKARQQRRKRAEELTKAEIAELRQIVLTQHQQIQSLAGGMVGFNANTLAERAQAKAQEIRQAEMIMARAIEAQNSADVVEAMRIRDQAKDELRQIEAAQGQLQQHRQAPPPQQAAAQPQIKPEVVNLARQWAAANPWYRHDGTDAESLTAKRIDAELVREGYDPSTREFWEELSDRCAEELPSSVLAARQPGRRNAPPIGGSRNHAPSTTRKEIRVTPERKQAMIDAGVWDDPVKRQRYLKAYQEFDSRAAS